MFILTNMNLLKIFVVFTASKEYNHIVKHILASITAYLIGSVSFSVIISKLFIGKDVRTSGSGNAGATNMARLYGILPGIVTLILDFLKQVLAMLLGRLIAGETGFCLAGLFCIIGHCFPLFFKFRGGKGVACAAAAAFLCSWKIGACAVIVFSLCAVLSRKVSLSSILACVVAELATLLLNIGRSEALMLSAIVVIVILRHSENITRLLKCREKSFRAASSKSKKNLH